MWRILPILFLMVSCASVPTPDPVVEAKLADAMIACHQAEEKKNAAIIAAIVDPKDALLFKAMDALEKAADKSPNRCKVTTNNDLQVVAMQENTKRSEFWLGFGKSALNTGLTGFLGWKAIDTLPDLFGQAKSSYTLTSEGDINISDAFKNVELTNLDGTFEFSDLITNPVEEVVFEPEVAEVVEVVE